MGADGRMSGALLTEAIQTARKSICERSRQDRRRGGRRGEERDGGGERERGRRGEERRGTTTAEEWQRQSLMLANGREGDGLTP
jgi:hypothetical protein